MTFTESQLIFPPQASHNFSHILNELKRANFSVSNRLRSIREDAYFVLEVAHALGRPIVANERCGSWYIHPKHKAGSAYFKSSDGHMNQWGFSSRRLNFQLLSIIGENDGCIIVDSTRRGKQMPDALSKTVPIWCCVINRALFPDHVQCHKLYAPPSVVSSSEHSQIESRIPDFVTSLQRLHVDTVALRKRISKPLRPIWVTQESSLAETEQIFEDFHPVICCTSSQRKPEGEMGGSWYGIQGAGDDTENWALGLTPELFWTHEDTLLSTAEPDMPALIRSLVEYQNTTVQTNTPIRVAPCISVCQSPASTQPSPTCTVKFVPQNTDQGTWVKHATEMEVGIGKQKTASRNLRVALPTICEFVRQYLDKCVRNSGEKTAMQQHILVACETGKDLCVGVALALLCVLFDEDGKYNPREIGYSPNKVVIKAKLGRIMISYPAANPSRSTLQSVNSYLMG
ncbi:initiator tRNA phosphoribosyl transferase [Xylariaceae sp. FL1019]|nr:initiator tRNA phosphoribosyl transferase [Xylariaceae sp. FL1019]